MKSLFFTIIFAFMTMAMAIAQARPVALSGLIVIDGADSIPYRLVITEANGEVSGYSLTYDAPYETKAKIKGTLDRGSHILTFRETEIDYIRGYHPGPSLCLIDAALYELRGTHGTALLGSVNTKEADHTACGSAKLIFKDQHEIEALFAYHEKYDTVISMKSRETKKDSDMPLAAQPSAAQPTGTDKITTGIEKTYNWHSDTVVIDIWDGGYIDGDKVTLLFNGAVTLSGYTLAKEKKQLRLPLIPGINTLVIHADNEGSDPPNTATMMLTDGNIKYSVLAYNKKGEEAIIKIKQVR